MGDGHSRICGSELSRFECMKNAWLLVSDGKIHSTGSMENLPVTDADVTDLSGKNVYPAFCDSHSHIVYAGSRETEFVDKIKGLSYEEIAKRGGGILQSAARLQKTSEEELFEQAMERVREMIGFGTGTLEIKSGYGLSVADEIKMLRVIRRIKESVQIRIKATFLGAHAFPQEYRENRDAYVDLIIQEMLPNIHAENLADYVDVFCDRGFFTPEQTDKILDASARYGLKPKIHANELANSGGVQVGVKHGALSVDHLECVEEEEIETLLHSNTMPTLLPGTAFFLGMEYPPARRMIEAGLPLALASDYNPGSSPSGNMMFVISLACIKMKMLPEEAFNAATLNGAIAMDCADTSGSLHPGKSADFFTTDSRRSLEFLPYAFTTKHVDSVYIGGIQCA